MGAFIITLLITRVARRQFGYDVRGSLIAFAIAAVVSIGLGSWGFATTSVTPLQTLPFVALGYGKFCLAFLIVDLDTAKRLKADPNYLKGRSPFGFHPTPAWILAGVVIAVGAYLSFKLPQPTASQAQASPPQRALVDTAWQTLVSDDGLFSVSLPGNPTASSRSQGNATGRPPILVHEFDLERGNAAYVVQYIRFEDAHIDPSATVERVLERTRDGMIGGMPGGQIISQRSIEYQGWPALETSFRAASGADTVQGRARIVLAGRTLYTLFTISESDDATERFFGSLRVVRASDDFRLPRRQAP